MTPEVRLSPDGDIVVIRNNGSSIWPWAGSNEANYSDEHVSDWTPLLPASSEDGAA
jgi:hypothetical protein